MKLTQQPPRRRSNLSIAGIVGAARMGDQSMEHHNETLGDYLYGEDLGLDSKVLAFLNISAGQFAESVEEYGDEILSKWVLEKPGITQKEIDEFNRTELERLPETEEYKERL